MLVILLRLLGVAALWQVTRVREANASTLTKRLYGLNWAGKIRLIRSLAQDSRIPIWARAIFAVPALYVVSPIDLLPDFIPFVGRLDDAFIFMLAVDVVSRAVPAAIMEEHVNRALD